MRPFIEIWSLIKFWGIALWESTTVGWWVCGVLSQLSWFLIPLIEKLDKSQQFATYTFLWEWLRFNGHWWATFVPLVAVVASYLVWAPYSYNKQLMTELDGHRDRLKPRLKFAFGNEIHECYSDDDGPSGDGHNPEATYLRLVVESDSDSDVIGVQANLVSIEKDGETHAQNLRPLPFSPCRLEDTRERTFKPGYRAAFDIFRIDKRTNKITIATKGKVSPVRNNKGEYLYETIGPTVLNIEIYAKDMKKEEKKLNFWWHGRCQNPNPDFSIKK